MQTTGLKYREYYSTLLWLSVSAIAFYLVHLKFLALDFHTRDYAFYTEFIIKWSRPVSEQSYSINPGGYNFLGIYADDGCDGFYQWVHFEPIRFVQAFIYRIFRSLSAVFIFNSLVVCSPILAITKWLSKTSTKGWEYFLWVLLFVAFPATLLVSGYDNRPSMFLGVGYFWLLYSLLVTKKIWLQFMFFALFFSIREESLILNSFVLLYLFFQWRKKEISIQWFVVFTMAWIFYLVGLLAYFKYWNYTLFQGIGQKYSIGVLISCLLGVVGVFGFILFRKRYGLILFVPMLLFLFQIFSMYSLKMFPDMGFSILNDPRLHMVNLIFLAFILSSLLNGSKLPRVMFFFIPFFLLGGIFIGKFSLNQKLGDWKIKGDAAKVVFDYQKKVPQTIRVVTDYYTHQAFVEHRNLYCLDRLPCYIEGSNKRFYPENQQLLKGILTENTTLVLSNKTPEKMQPLLNELGFLSVPAGKDDYLVLPLILSQHMEFQP